MTSEDHCQETTNYGYQPYNQLVKNLYSKNEKINELKLLTCNVNRTNVALKNANSQLNKLITLISKEESPRIATFFSTWIILWTQWTQIPKKKMKN